MHGRPGIVLQARLASTRLPGKALYRIGGHALLEHCLSRLAAGGLPVALATTTRREDDALVEVAERHNALVFRGSVDDVLGRFVAAAAAFRFDPVLRATGDNPCVDMDAPARIVRAFAQNNVSYVREIGLPLGASVEGVSFDALRRASKAATLSSDREHVTTYIRRRRHEFRAATVIAPAALRRPDLRLTVDTIDDLQRVRERFERAGVEQPSLADLLAADETALAEVMACPRRIEVVRP